MAHFTVSAKNLRISDHGSSAQPSPLVGRDGLHNRDEQGMGAVKYAHDNYFKHRNFH